MFIEYDIIDVKQQGGKLMMKIYIDGMMCQHCEATVKKALEKLDFVAEAEASHEKGTAVIRLCGEMDENAVRKAIADEDYELLEIQVQAP